MPFRKKYIPLSHNPQKETKMTKEEKALLLRWFDRIAQMADDRKTLTGEVMDDAHTLDEIKALAKDASEFIKMYWPI